MSTFADVRDGTCRVLTDDGAALDGTAFCVLDGYLLTAHHVVFGLRRILVQFNGRPEIVEATYCAERSNPAGDIAVLQIPAGSLKPIQVARTRAGADVYGYGYRPSTLDQEPDGHTFSGSLGLGQTLRTPVSANAKAKIAAMPPTERGAWNDFSDDFRSEQCCNLEQAKGLEGGISGGPIYDTGLRRVTGLFRAVENGDVAYVIPLDIVLVQWPQLITDNASTVPDAALDSLDQTFGIKLVSEGARPQTPVLQRSFDALLARHTLFGGRGNELQALAQFASDPKRAYFFVTGPAGFGKSALLANLITSIAPAQAFVAYHFFSKTVEGSLNAAYFYANMCEQLMAFHGVGGNMPGAELLPMLFRTLLQLEPPPERQLIVVIDGLDEPLGTWTPGPDFFPAHLPSSAHVVFSARDVADCDWPASLGLNLTASDTLSLGKLDRAGIGDVLAALPPGTVAPALTQPLIDRLWELSAGDVFYLRDLLDDLQKRNSYDPAGLAAYPIGHNAYLKAWWQDADSSDKGFKDLMGLLVVARDALTKPELAAIAPDDELDEWTIDSKIAKAARYITGDEDAGYRLSQTRIVEFISARLGAALALYQTRIAQYCEQWSAANLDEHARRYVLHNGARHVADAGRYDALFALLDGAWLAATWRDRGSYVGLIDDLGIAADLAYSQTPPDLGRMAGAAVARATARTLLGETSAAMLAAITRLGDPDRVIAMMRAERGVARTPPVMYWIAKELLRTPAASIAPERRLAQKDFALTLLQRVLDAADGDSVLLAYMNLLKALDGAADLEDARKREFIEQLHAGTEAHPRDPVRRSAILGWLAKALATLALEPAIALLDEADAIATTLTGSERFAADAFLLPARIALRGLEVVPALNALIDSADDPFADFAREAPPLFFLLDAVPWDGQIAKPEPAIALLTVLFQRAIGASKVSVFIAGCIMRAYCKLKAHVARQQFYEQIFKMSPQLAAATVVDAAKELCVADGDTFVAWMTSAEVVLHPLAAAKAWGSGGEWNRATDAVANVWHGDPAQRAERTETFVNLLRLMDEVPPAGATLPIVQRLLELADFDDDNGPAILAAAACAVLASDAAAAKALFDRAISMELGRFPSGDVADVRRFFTIAAAQAGHISDALAQIQAMPRGAAQTDAFAGLIDGFPPGPAEVTAYATGLAATISAPEFANLYEFYDAALRLYETVLRRCPALQDVIEESFQGWTRAWVMRATRTIERYSPDYLNPATWPAFDQWARLAGRIARAAREAAAPLLETLRGLEEPQSPRIRQNIALLYEIATTGDAASSTAASDTAMHDAIAACLGNEMASADARAWFAIELGMIAEAIDLLSRVETSEAPALIDAYLDHCMALPEGWARGLAMVQFWRCASRCDPATVARMNGTFVRALDIYGGPFAQQQLLDTVSDMLAALSAAGNDDLAHHLVDRLGNESDRNFARGSLQMIDVSKKFGTLTPLEGLYLSRAAASGFPQVVLERLRAGEDPNQTLTTFARALAKELVVSDREGVLDANVWPLLLPAYTLHGTDSIAAMIEGITLFDARFHDAAERLRGASK